MVAVICATYQRFHLWIESQGIKPYSKEAKRHISITGARDLNRIRGCYLDEVIVLDQGALTDEVRGVLAACQRR